jgi:hypothetical protein
MMNWAKQQLAYVAGTQEPEYGPDAIQPVTKQAEETPYTELTKDKLAWALMEQTCVETQTWYYTTDSGHIGMNQIIYSNVANLRVSAQVVSKLFFPDRTKPFIWCSDVVENFSHSPDKYNFFGDNYSVELSEDGTSYHIKSAVNEECLADIKISRVTPGFVAGKDGTSHFGTDPSAPWGSMHHAFWPRCKVEGKFFTKEGEVDMAGKGFFVHAIQGMKPHHAAARWNFLNFQSSTYSASIMEFTTPPSYANTKVTVGVLAKDGKLIYAGTNSSVTHTETAEDGDNGWPEPKAAAFTWKGKTDDGQEVSAELSGSLGERLDRIDVMFEVPAIIKQIVAGTVGTKPFIYQYSPKLTLKIRIGEEEHEEEGMVLFESTFIS